MKQSWLWVLRAIKEKHSWKSRFWINSFSLSQALPGTLGVLLSAGWVPADTSAISLALQILFLSPLTFHNFFFFVILPGNQDYRCVSQCLCGLFKHKQFHSWGRVNNLNNAVISSYRQKPQ